MIQEFVKKYSNDKEMLLKILKTIYAELVESVGKKAMNRTEFENKYLGKIVEITLRSLNIPFEGKLEKHTLCKNWYVVTQKSYWDDNDEVSIAVRKSHIKKIKIIEEGSNE